MRSGTSFFDKTLFRKTVRRFWPLWAVNLVFWLFLLPLRGLMDFDTSHSTGAYNFARGVGGFAEDLGVVVAVGISLLVAMAVCSHLYNHRSANFMGALPCRREGQFLSFYAAGLAILLLPNVAVFLLTLLVEAAQGFVIWSSLLYWLGAMCAMELFFFSLAVCMGQITGHILALPVFYGIANAIVIALYALLSWVCQVYFFGYAGIAGGLPRLVNWLTPAVKFSEMSYSYAELNYATVTNMVRVEGGHIAAVYTVAAVVLAVCAMLLYRRRHLETAGDVVAVKVLRPVFVYGVAICTGLFFGFLMEQMFDLTELGMLIWMILWGIIGYFVAQMLLEKSVRVFKKWKGMLAVTAAFLLLFAVVAFDLVGYESRLPDREDVVSVQFSGLQGGTGGMGYSLSQVVLTDPADIDRVIELHSRIVAAGGDTRRVDEYGRITFNVAYTMKDGSRLVRRYSVFMDEQTRAVAQQIRDLPHVRRQAYGLDGSEEDGRLELAWLHFDNGNERTEIDLIGEDAERLWAAVMTDFELGLIGRNQVGRYAEKYEWCSVEFRFRVPTRWIEIGSGEPQEMASEGWTSRYYEFPVGEEAVHTMAVVKELQSAYREKTEPSYEDILAGAR